MVILRNRLSAEERKKGKQEKDSKIPGGSGAFLEGYNFC
jgi:hypothetical protein